MKRTIVRGIRSLNLLRSVDRARYYLRRLRAWPGDRRFRKAHPDFAVPPLDLAFDAFDHVRLDVYRDQGYRHAEGRKLYLAVHPERWVREVLLSEFEEVRVDTRFAAPDLLQDIWIARRPRV